MRGFLALRIIFVASAVGAAGGAWMVGSAIADGNVWKGVAGLSVFTLSGMCALSFGILLRAA